MTSPIEYPPGCGMITEDLSMDELIKRLQSIFHSFQITEQDEDNTIYIPLGLYLANDFLLENSSKNVRILLACSLAEIFRFFAPNPPYQNPDIIKKIFLLFIEQLKGAQDPNDAFYEYYLYLIENLSWIKTFNFIIQFEYSEEIICRLFSSIFEITEKNPGIKVFILDMLSGIFIGLKNANEGYEYSKLLARFFIKYSYLPKMCPEIWNFFLNQFQDHNVLIRISCVQYSMHFLINHRELCPDICEQLKQRQYDVNENVRFEVVRAIVSSAKKRMNFINEELLNVVKERALEDKFKIRCEALLGMSQLYRQYNYYFTKTELDILNEEEYASLRKLNCIKDICMHNYYRSQLEDKLLVQRIFYTNLVPFSLNMGQRMKALYMFYCTVDLQSVQAFDEMLQQQQAVRWQMKEVIDVICRTDQMDNREALLKEKIALVAKNLAEPVKANEFINKFVKNLENNPTLKQHMILIVNTGSFIELTEEKKYILPATSDTIENTKREILRLFGCPRKKDLYYMIIEQLLERIASIIIDYEGLLMLLNFIFDSLIGNGELNAQMNLSNSAIRGLQLIKIISSVFPALFYTRIIFNNYLLPFLWHKNSNPKIAEIVLQILNNIDPTAYSDIESKSISFLPWWIEDGEFVSRFIDNFILKAATIKQAKYSIQFLNTIILDEAKKMKIYLRIINKINYYGLSLTSPYFRFHLTALSMIAVNGGHSTFSDLFDIIAKKFVIQELLHKDFRSKVEIVLFQSVESKKNLTNINTIYEHLSNEVKTKIEGIKLLVRWIYGLKLNSLMEENRNEANIKYRNEASNALQLLKRIIQTNGDITEQDRAGTLLEKAFLKLSAALAMLKIASNDSVTSINPINKKPIFQKFGYTLDIMSTEQWLCLSNVFFDEHEFVRENFLTKLNKGLISMNLGMEFLSYLSLGGLFDDTFKNKVKTCLQLNVLKRRELVKTRMTDNIRAIMPECVLPFVIYLLSHTSFYTKFNDILQLNKIKECLWFIMEPLITENEFYSFTFFKKTFDNIKLSQDAVATENFSSNLTKLLINYKIFAATDLALNLVIERTQNFIHKKFLVQPDLPEKYYIPSNNLDNVKQIYLPEEMNILPLKRLLKIEIDGNGK